MWLAALAVLVAPRSVRAQAAQDSSRTGAYQRATLELELQQGGSYRLTE